jgi:membrane-bound lytic murein transglycosylase A
VNFIRVAGLVFFSAFLLAACTVFPPEKKPAEPEAIPAKPVEILRPSSFSDLPGWDRDDLLAAWPAFLNSCQVLIKKDNWREPCTLARQIDANDRQAVRRFFESLFTPYQVFNKDGSETGLATGYYEPLLLGARKKSSTYQTPLHRVPDDLLTIDLASVYPSLKGMRLRGRLVGNKVEPYYSREEIVQSSRMKGKVLLWVDDPVEAFFLQVQGSGRVYLPAQKQTVRVVYADQNGRPYRSIGRYLVDRGELSLDSASAQGIKDWFIANPSRQQELLNANPSYVFFREEKLGDPKQGPKGAMGIPLTPRRSIAVDPAYIPLGAPVFLNTTEPNSSVPMQRLVMAQDTGGAIKNPVRADYFWGFGADAGKNAGKMRQKIAMWVLLPK